MPNSEILIGGTQFWERLNADIQTAKTSISIQCMSFEGDTVGTALIDALIAAKAPRKRLLIDAYSSININDTFLLSAKGRKSAKIRSEATETQRQIVRAKAAGIQVTVTNPLGFLWRHFPKRNHKKMAVIDSQISYLGGINFCEHNFAWRDFMIRTDCQEVGSILDRDADQTEKQSNQNHHHNSSPQLLFLDGIKSRRLNTTLRRYIDAATTSIDVYSAYLCEPHIMRTLVAAAKRGVTVRVLTPRTNNKPIATHVMHHTFRHTPVRIISLPQMTHAKAILIDGKQLIAGSYNFDVISYYCEQEIVAIYQDNALIDQFVTKLLGPDIQGTKNWTQKPSLAETIAVWTLRFIRIILVITTLPDRLR